MTWTAWNVEKWIFSGKKCFSRKYFWQLSNIMVQWAAPWSPWLEKNRNGLSDAGSWVNAPWNGTYDLEPKKIGNKISEKFFHTNNLIIWLPNCLTRKSSRAKVFVSSGHTFEVLKKPPANFRTGDHITNLVVIYQLLSNCLTIAWQFLNLQYTRFVDIHEYKISYEYGLMSTV